MKKTRAVKAWGLKKADGTILAKAWIYKENAKTGLTTNWLKEFNKVIRVEIRELRRGNK